MEDGFKLSKTRVLRELPAACCGVGLMTLDTDILTYGRKQYNLLVLGQQYFHMFRGGWGILPLYAVL